MKTILTPRWAAICIAAYYFLTGAPSYGQTIIHGHWYEVLLDSAKTLFRQEKGLDQEQLDKFDYSHIVSLLNRVIELKPDDAEARYFLGYTYSRINSRDGRSMVNANPELVLKTSGEFEKVIKLTPKYEGEMAVLDPYSKLTAEWGSLGMEYLYNHKADSAAWAFAEGKKRGGFGDFILELNKKALDACSPNSILISSGDNFTIPLWYLQIAQGYRKDVSVIDISLLNTGWYPGYLVQNHLASFDLPKAALDTLQYVYWTAWPVTINNFTWTVKPSYDHYLLRGDRIFLSLLKENKFKRDIYFTPAFEEDSRLSLKDYVSSFLIVDKLTLSERKPQSFPEYRKSIISILQLSKYLSLNSQDEGKLFDFFRYLLVERAENLLAANEGQKARELFELLDAYGNDEKIPYQDNQQKRYADYVRSKL